MQFADLSDEHQDETTNESNTNIWKRPIITKQSLLIIIIIIVDLQLCFTFYYALCISQCDADNRWLGNEESLYYYWYYPCQSTLPLLHSCGLTGTDILCIFITALHVSVSVPFMLPDLMVSKQHINNYFQGKLQVSLTVVIPDSNNLNLLLILHNKHETKKTCETPKRIEPWTLHSLVALSISEVWCRARFKVN